MVGFRSAPTLSAEARVFRMCLDHNWMRQQRKEKDQNESRNKKLRRGAEYAELVEQDVQAVFTRL